MSIKLWKSFCWIVILQFVQNMPWELLVQLYNWALLHMNGGISSYPWIFRNLTHYKVYNNVATKKKQASMGQSPLRLKWQVKDPYLARAPPLSHSLMMDLEWIRVPPPSFGQCGNGRISRSVPNPPDRDDLLVGFCGGALQSCPEILICGGQATKMEHRGSENIFGWIQCIYD